MQIKKILSHTLPLIVAYCVLIPPIDFRIPAPYEHWHLTIAIVCMLGIRILFIRTNIIIKIIPMACLLSCFFSSIPTLSYNAYISIVACCYLYIGLTRMDSWEPMFNVLKSILIFNCILLGMQLTGNDNLINFGLDTVRNYGLVGHKMQFGSFSVILASLLGIISPLFFLFPLFVGIVCKTTWTLVCAGVGFWCFSKTKLFKIFAIIVLIAAIVMGIKTDKIQMNFNKIDGRRATWTRSIEMANEEPLTGWGPGTYKVMFPALADLTYTKVPWKTAHNDWVQLAFELGYILFTGIIIIWLFLLRKIIRSKNKALFAGFIVISLNMVAHFPTRMIQCVPLIITFFAYYDGMLRWKK